MLRRVIYIAADGADIFSRCFFLCEVELLKHGLYRVIQVHNPLRLQVLVALRSMGAAINSRVIPNKFTHTVQGLTGSLNIIINN